MLTDTPIKIYHEQNPLGQFMPDAGRELKLVFEWEAMVDPMDGGPLLEEIFKAFNVGHDALSEVVHNYRSQGLRSLSVMDVVVIGEVAWECMPSGWKTYDGGLPVDA